MSFMVFNPEDKWTATFAYAEDAAIFISAAGPEGTGTGYAVKDHAGRRLWTEGKEAFLAAESFDRFAEVIYARIAAIKANAPGAPQAGGFGQSCQDDLGRDVAPANEE